MVQHNNPPGEGAAERDKTLQNHDGKDKEERKTLNIRIVLFGLLYDYFSSFTLFNVTGSQFKN